MSITICHIPDFPDKVRLTRCNPHLILSFRHLFPGSQNGAHDRKGCDKVPAIDPEIPPGL
jgi:hypothetical protein